MADETQSFTSFSMSNYGETRQIPARSEPPARLPGFVTGDILQRPLAGGDPCVPLLNLSTVRARMDSLQQFLSDKVQGNALIGQDQMAMVSTEIAAAIQQIIVNGAALLACSQTPIQYEESTGKPLGESDLKVSESVGNENATAPATTADSMRKSRGKGVASPTGDTMDEDAKDEIGSEEWEIIEMDAVELLAEHVHFCEVCGKGFKRDANLRMHMRAHGNQFKTPEALAKPAETCAAQSRRRTRFSCPFEGCNRNRKHSKFRALKSAICVKNHFKRSHCPKIYSCTGCNKKTFSVLADLKSHLKHCGKSKWNCSCGTSFSRKDKLFGHMALFEGHAPAVAEAEAALMTEDEEEEELQAATEMEVGANGLFEGLLEGFGSIENHRLQDVLGYPDTSLATDLGDFYNFS